MVRHAHTRSRTRATALKIFFQKPFPLHTVLFGRHKNLSVNLVYGVTRTRFPILNGFIQKRGKIFLTKMNLVCCQRLRLNNYLNSNSSVHYFSLFALQEDFSLIYCIIHIFSFEIFGSDRIKKLNRREKFMQIKMLFL